ncbi:MAG: aldo/keto reductase, partial [Wenzhouxiangella sp.]
LNLPGYEWLRDLLLDEEGQEKLAAVGRLQPVAEELGISLTHMAIAWCLRNPNVSTVILGASRLSQLKHNLAALDAVPKLSDEVMARIDRILGNRPADPERFGQ